MGTDCRLVLPTLQDEDKSWQKQKKTDQKCLTMITMAAQSISLILLVTTLNISISQALPRGSQKSIFGSTEGYDDPYFDRPVQNFRRFHIARCSALGLDHHRCTDHVGDNSLFRCGHTGTHCIMEK